MAKSEASWLRGLALATLPGSQVKFDAIRALEQVPEDWILPGGALSHQASQALNCSVGLSVDKALVKAALAWRQGAANRHICLWSDHHYPAWLKETPVPPVCLFVEGSLTTLSEPSIAIVGSRAASTEARQQAYQDARELAQSGWTVVSGLAKGVDAAAHQGAIEVGGRTIACLGHGLSNHYPKDTLALRAEILAKGGTVISEYFPSRPPKPYQFLARNRLIAGLSLGTLVIAAGERSGALNTARHANESGRLVFTRIHCSHDEAEKGCLQLVQDGAMLINDIATLQQECLPMLSESLKPLLVGLTDTLSPTHGSRHCAAPTTSPITLEAWLQQTHSTHHSLGQMLAEIAEMRLNGKLSVVPGGIIPQFTGDPL